MPAPVIYFDLGNTLVFGPTENKQPFDDAVATIETLWLRGYQIGLLSNQSPSTTLADMGPKLTDYGLEAYRFDVITISSEFSPPISKPDPQILQAALTKAGFASASNQTVFITETLSHIQAARDLGWRAIHKPFGTACSPASGECIDTLDDLLDMFPPLAVDVYLRDNTGDDGDEPSSGSFWNSPDLWIRNENDGGTNHQGPKAGQDNWFYARVHNRGEGIARWALVWHKVQEWAGTQFVYSADYYPATALVGAIIHPGSSTIARVKWPEAKVPVAGVHACWTSAVIMAGDPIPNPAHVWEANNLAQKNLTILEMEPDETAEMAVVIGSRAAKLAQAITLEFWQPSAGIRLEATLRTDIPRMLEAAIARGRTIPKTLATAPDTRPHAGLRFLEPTRVEMRGLISDDREAAVLQLAAGSTIDFAPETLAPFPAKQVQRRKSRAPAPLNARLVKDAKGRSTVQFADGKASAFALGLRASEALKTRLSLRIPKNAVPGETITVDLIQRGSDGIIVGGIAVEVRVVKPRQKKSKTTKTS